MRKILFFLLISIPILAFGQGSMDFEGITLPSGTNYVDGSFTENGIEYTYKHSLNQGDFPIDGQGLMLRRASDSYFEWTIPNGIGQLDFQYRKAHTGQAPRQLEIYVNGEVTFTTDEFGAGSGAQDDIYSFNGNIDLEGAVTIKIKNVGTATTNKQSVIDNISWTAFDDEGEPNTCNIYLVAQVNEDCVEEAGQYSVSVSIEGSSDNESYTIVDEDFNELESNATIGETYVFYFDAGMDILLYAYGNQDENCDTDVEEIDSPEFCPEPYECPELVGYSGHENFNQFDPDGENGNAYKNGEFVGQSGIVWNYLQARSDSDAYIHENDKALMLGRNRTPDAELTSNSIADGISSLQFEFMQAFSSTTGMEVYVITDATGPEGELVYTAVSETQNEPVCTGEIDLSEYNFTGDFQLRFYNPNGAGQINIDNIYWTSNEDEGEEPNNNPYSEGDTDNVFISSIYIYSGFGTTYDLDYSSDAKSEGGYGIIDSPQFSVFPGMPGTVSLSSGPAGDNGSYHYKVWIDLDGDGEFNDALASQGGELVVVSGVAVPNNYQVQLEFPQFMHYGGLEPGTYQARVRNSAVDVESLNPDGYGDGEALDFTINILSEYDANYLLSVDSPLFEAFTFYPNPVENQLNLNAGNTIEQVVVYNLLGQKVMNVNPNALNAVIELDRLDSGVYMMNVTIEGTQKSFRIIKK